MPIGSRQYQLRLQYQRQRQYQPQRQPWILQHGLGVYVDDDADSGRWGGSFKRAGGEGGALDVGAVGALE